MNNYKKIDEHYIKEIDATFTTYEHIKTKAKVATIECDDDNKVFSIAFRTPPIDNSGLTHILEHSVLCGSRKYPVKDPFVELLKSSLNTFLNAMTFADKTMYPFASKNTKDFNNLMDVYMDAVFYPNIYEHKEIFEQEGWHYHIESKEDEIKYNGVVYNEMKGAFSDPSEIIARTIKKSLFPDNVYGYESGGDPKDIPSLTYEKFLDFHSKYYSASNSYIIIYGNCDMEERLEFLDKEYLSNMDYVDFDTEIKYQEPFKREKYKTEYYKLDGDLNNKTFLSYNVVLPSTLDNKLCIAMDIVVCALFNVTGAPIKEAIIKSGIGDDVDVSIDFDLLEPILSIEVSNANSKDEERLIELIDNELEKVIKNGLDRNSILSIINHEEFSEREKSFSPYMPLGLLISISSLATWLYDDKNPYGKLELTKYFNELKDDLRDGYFEQLVEKYILNNKHKSFVKLVPTNDEIIDESITKLNNMKKSLTDDEIEELVNETLNLIEYQNRPDSKEDLDTIPKLTLDDISSEPDKYDLEVTNRGYEVLFSDYRTNGISYLKYYFDLNDINKKDLLYLSLFSNLLLKMNTDKHSYYQISESVRSNLGVLSFNVYPYSDINKKVNIVFSIAISALDAKFNDIYEILDEVLYHTDFSDTSRIYEIIAEIKSSLDVSISGRGSVFALNKALSTFDYQSYISDLLNGIGYKDFINELYDNFDKYKDELVDKLNSYNKYLTKNNFKAGYTGALLNEFVKRTDLFYHNLPDNIEYEKLEFNPEFKNIAIKTPFNVNFVARCGIYDEEYNGSFAVLQNALSLDYLWDRVRVHGGAYGASLKINLNNTLGFASYRDPNIDRTDKVYQEVVEYINNLDLTEEELLKYKIGAIGNNQTVLHNKDKAETARSEYLTGKSFEFRKNNRRKLLDTTLDDLKNLAQSFEHAINNSSICVIGNKDMIEKSNIKFDEIRDL